MKQHIQSVLIMVKNKERNKQTRQAGGCQSAEGINISADLFPRLRF